MPGPRVDTSGQKVTRTKFLKPLAPSSQLKERYRTLEILSLSAVTDLGENRSDLEGGTTMQTSRTWGSALNQSPDIPKLCFICP